MHTFLQLATNTTEKRSRVIIMYMAKYSFVKCLGAPALHWQFILGEWTGKHLRKAILAPKNIINFKLTGSFVGKKLKAKLL